jgi:gluconate 2-dehydrogenase gamma chain
VAWYKHLSRREFIKTATAAALVAGTACNSERSPWRYLRVREARTLAAICDCLIPPDSDPGAEWAQVVNYIDLQLCGPFRELRDTYRSGVANVELTAQKNLGKPFSSLNLPEQTTLMSELEQGIAPKEIWTVPSAKQFFELVLAHTMEGYYGDPRHGGNRERASWKMLGLSYPQVRGRSRAEVAARKS